MAEPFLTLPLLFANQVLVATTYRPHVELRVQNEGAHAATEVQTPNGTTSAAHSGRLIQTH